MSVTRDELLGPPITAEYAPLHYGMYYLPSINRHRPRFAAVYIREMLADPRVAFGLWLIKGPILQNARFKIEIDEGHDDVREFLVKNVTRFWRTSASRALKAVEWGWSGSEVMFRMRDEKIHFDTLKDIASPDTHVVTLDGQLVGMNVKNVPDPRGHRRRIYIGVPKCLWHVHDRHHSAWYGRSRLFGAYPSWWEQWSEGGYRDIRRLWFHKNAYDGGKIYHPTGSVKRDTTGIAVPAKDYAREMIEQHRTGGVWAFPNTRDAAGNFAWVHEPPQSNPPPDSIIPYGESLRDEVWEGMGIPPEVARAEGTGAFAGRRVPQQAFYATLQELVQWLMFDFDQQVLRTLVLLNFGDVDYEITPFGLIRQAAKPEQPDLEGEQPQMTQTGAEREGMFMSDRFVTVVERGHRNGQTTTTT